MQIPRAAERLSPLHSIKELLLDIDFAAADFAVKTADLRHLVLQILSDGAAAESLPLATDRPKGQFQFVILAPLTKKDSNRPKHDCPFCRHKNLFWNGFVLLCSDGQLRLIGHECKDTQEVEHLRKEAIAEYNDFVLRDFAANWLPQASTAVGAVAQAVRSFISVSPNAATRCVEFFKAVDQNLPPLFDALREHVSSGRLMVERRVLDFSAIERDRTEGDGDRKRRETQTVHHLTGIGFLNASGRDPNRELEGVVAQLNRVARDIGDLQHRPEANKNPTKQARAIHKALEQALKALIAPLMLLRDAERFMARANLIGICRWVNDPAGPVTNDLELRLDGQQLIGTFPVGNDVVVNVPSGYAAPSFQSLRDLERLVARLGVALGRKT